MDFNLCKIQELRVLSPPLVTGQMAEILARLFTYLGLVIMAKSDMTLGEELAEQN